MKTLSKEAEQQIIEAAKEAVDIVDETGQHPNSAIEKSARQHRWTADTIKFACYAYNTGRQTAQRESADTALEKFASFPLADPQQIIKEVFPSKEATVKAAAEASFKTVSEDYSFPPTWLDARARSEKTAWVQREKTAFVQAPKEPPRVTADQVLNKHTQLKKAFEESRYQAGQAHTDLLNAIGNLGAYFHKMSFDRLPFNKVAYVASTYFGKPGETLMRFVYNRNRLKEAQSTEKVGFVTADFDASPFKELKACIKAAEYCNVKRAAESAAKQALEKHAVDQLAPLVSRPKIEKAAESSPFLPANADRKYYDTDSVRAFLPHQFGTTKTAFALPAPVKEEPWSLMGKSADISGNVSGAMIGAGTKQLMERAFAGSDDRVRDAQLELDDPAHDAQLRQIRAQALLTDLMNDDVIGGYDPEHVMKAYNDISQLAPRTAEQPLAIRALLRRHLQGNVEPHEVGEAASLEKNIMGTKTPVPDSYQAGPASASAKTPGPDALTGFAAGSLMKSPASVAKSTGSLIGGPAKMIANSLVDSGADKQSEDSFSLIEHDATNSILL